MQDSTPTAAKVRTPKSVPPFQDDYDEEVFLVVKRDIPSIQSSLSEIKDEMKDMSEKQDSQSADHNLLVTQVATLSSKVDSGFSGTDKRLTELFDEIKLFANKEELPWYRSFEKVLILLLVLGLGTLAGVKSYNDVINKVPWIGNAATPAHETTVTTSEGP